MAETIGVDELDQLQRLDLSATANQALQITIDRNVRTLEVTFKTAGGGSAAGWYSHTGTDGAAIGSEAFPVDAGLTREIKLAGRGRPASDHVLFFASASANAKLHIVARNR